jgi:hypothetical protein
LRPAVPEPSVMDFPITDLLDQDACYRKLVDLLHPAFP